VKGYGSAGAKAHVEPGSVEPKVRALPGFASASYLFVVYKPAIASSSSSRPALFHFKASNYSLVSCAREFHMPLPLHCHTPSPGIIPLMILQAEW